MQDQTAQNPQDFLDILKEDVTNEVRRTLAYAKGTLDMIREEEKRTGKTAVSERSTERGVRFTEVLTGRVVAEYDSAEIHAAGGLWNLMPEGHYVFIGDGFMQDAHDVIHNRLQEEGEYELGTSALEDAMGDLLGEAILVSEKQFAEFVGESPEDVRLARLFRAWQNGGIDAPVEPRTV